MNWEKLSVFIDDTLTTLTTLWSSQKVHNEIEAAKSAAAADAASKTAVVQTSLTTHTANKNNPHDVSVSQIGAETPDGAQSKADAAKSAAISTAATDATTKANAVQTNVDAHIANKNNPHTVTVAQIGAETPTGSQAKADAAKTAAIAAAATDATTKANAVQGNLNTHTANVTDAHDLVNRLQTVRNYCDQAVANLVNGSPAALDTLYELANALGNDPNFSATVMNLIGQKAAKATTIAGYGITDAYTKTEADGKYASTGYGLGTNVLPTVSDLNNATITGFYRINASETNRPEDFGHLFVMAYSTEITHFFIGILTGATYSRKYRTGVGWSSWKQIPTMDMVAPAGYGLGTKSATLNSIDLNTVKTNGFYYAYSCTNRPTTGHGHLMVESVTDAYVKQSYFDITTNDFFYTRACINSTWQSWNKILLSTSTFNSVRVLRDVARYFGSSATTTGTIKITYPNTWDNTMMHIKITGFNYTSNSIWSVDLGGYTYSSGPNWANACAVLSPNCPFTSVRWGHDGTNCCILLGTTTTVWAYPSIKIDEVQASFTGYSGLSDIGWSISLITAETGITIAGSPVTKTITDNSRTDIFAPAGYGLGGKTVTVNGADLNTVLTTGFYYASGSPPNAPTTSNGYLLVESVSDSYTKQTYCTFGSDRLIFVRTCDNGTWGTWIKLSRDDNTISSVRVLKDVARVWNNNGGTTGTLKITFPVGWNSTMMRIRVTGFNYSANPMSVWEATLGGYNHTGATWYYPSAVLSPNCPFTSVRFGFDGTYCCILLGVTTTSWGYPAIKIDEIQLSAGGVSAAYPNWTMSFITDETGITFPNNSSPIIKTLATLESPTFVTPVFTGTSIFSGARPIEVNPASGTITTTGPSTGTWALANTAKTNDSSATMSFGVYGSANTISYGYVGVYNDPIITFSPNKTIGVPGGQLAFPATQNASTDPNTLDDYEEGTFTPVVIGTTTAGTGTYTTQVGRYTKIGNTVNFSAYIAITAHTGTGNIRIQGLPFGVSAALSQPCSILVTNLTFSGQLCVFVGNSSSSIYVYQCVSNAVVSEVPIDTSFGIWVNGTYFTS